MASPCHSTNKGGLGRENNKVDDISVVCACVRNSRLAALFAFEKEEFILFYISRKMCALAQ